MFNSRITFGVCLWYILSCLKKGDGDVEGTQIVKAIAIFIVGLLSAFFQPLAVERVDAGHVGIKVNLTGDNRGVGSYEYKTGWVVYNTWTSKLYEFPTFQQTIEYPEQQIITKGGFSATIHPKFNYSLKPGNVGDMFSNLRLDVLEVEQGWLQTAIVGAMNDVANKWAVDDIFNKREQFESDIITEANKRLSKWFTISQLRTNIIPPKALQESIEQKTRAIQNVQVAENERLVAIAQGDKTIAQARADSAAKVITAAGDAEAMRRKQLVLTENYLEYMKIQSWDGKLPVYSGSGSGLILNLPK
jgi:regulator of protease activity HflC (stomatin/prohibitin superfamily)